MEWQDGKRVGISTPVASRYGKTKNEVFVPNGDFVLKTEDILVIGAKNFKEEEDIHLREIIIKKRTHGLGCKYES